MPICHIAVVNQCVGMFHIQSCQKTAWAISNYIFIRNLIKQQVGRTTAPNTIEIYHPSDNSHTLPDYLHYRTVYISNLLKPFRRIIFLWFAFQLCKENRNRSKQKHVFVCGIKTEMWVAHNISDICVAETWMPTNQMIAITVHHKKTT